ncbi:SRPBCC domain-containing protein [Scleromatobacter humisilvae]|uniref:SRPBCC domain-containing protein n=1 Tax=Scleromatobacter humisilvae TaxID=2897159 RepID=A0A9X1YJ20_9BURK|nr:SRPBCC domain-containing protein [Scleromatobacter humisilvae]MCK9686831.1 SRPBCC domain-containing protein [Scleromatobacter humisilvae]
MTSPLNAPITTHGDFSINRVYDASPADVWTAWADPATKARWFIGPEGWSEVERTLDMRVGGSEILHGRFASNGLETLFSARYHLVEPQARLVYVYDMLLSGRHHSVSIATVEFIGDPEGTRLRFTEQVTFVDGTDGRDGTLSRKRGTSAHLERIAGVL